jgi:hypothetical protein
MALRLSILQNLKTMCIDYALRWISVAPLNTAEQEQQITEATMRDEVHGTIGFHQKISKLISRVTKLTAHGGDRKSKDYTNQAG